MIVFCCRGGIKKTKQKTGTIVLLLDGKGILAQQILALGNAICLEFKKVELPGGCREMRTDVALQPSSKRDANQPESGRRKFLKWFTGGVGALAFAPELLKAAVLRERSLLFYNSNTSETIRRVYWTPRDGYIREAIGEISWALRDHHNDQVKLFDAGVLDQFYALQLQLGFGSPIHVISGYRSPSTNWMLYERGRGVARNSYHMQAMALDIRIPGGRVSDLYQVARSLGAGGVGYYPRANFVHIDSGPVRHWG